MLNMFFPEHQLQLFRELEARRSEFEQLDRQDQATKIKSGPQRLSAQDWETSIAKKQKAQNLVKVRRKGPKGKYSDL